MAISQWKICLGVSKILFFIICNELSKNQRKCLFTVILVDIEAVADLRRKSEGAMAHPEGGNSKQEGTQIAIKRS